MREVSIVRAGRKNSMVLRWVQVAPFPRESVKACARSVMLKVFRSPGYSLSLDSAVLLTSAVPFLFDARRWHFRASRCGRQVSSGSGRATDRIPRHHLANRAPISIVSIKTFIFYGISMKIIFNSTAKNNVKERVFHALKMCKTSRLFYGSVVFRCVHVYPTRMITRLKHLLFLRYHRSMTPKARRLLAGSGDERPLRPLRSLRRRVAGRRGGGPAGGGGVHCVSWRHLETVVSAQDILSSTKEIGHDTNCSLHTCSTE